MYWRVLRSEFEKQKGAGNKRALKKIVSQGRVPGLLAYAGGEPVGWCAVEPREAYATLERSRLLKRLDEQRVWSVVCFFIAKSYRNKSVSVELLKAAVAHARKHGAQIVEGYPVEPKKGKMPDVFAWTGIAAAFRQAGFKEVARPSATRPVMRYLISRSRKDRT
jgi:N-acetylglutamate synthase-like GNAT family acetyltransferase